MTSTDPALTYRVIADGEVLYTGQPLEEAEWNAHDAERSHLYDTVLVQPD